MVPILRMPMQTPLTSQSILGAAPRLELSMATPQRFQLVVVTELRLVLTVLLLPWPITVHQEFQPILGVSLGLEQNTLILLYYHQMATG